MHRDKQPQSVHYTSRMPDIDTLMQEWPAEVQRLLSQIQLPSAELDVDIKEYADIICSEKRNLAPHLSILMTCSPLAIFDIPTGKGRIQALHLLFTLFVEFRNSQVHGTRIAY